MPASGGDRGCRKSSRRWVRRKATSRSILILRSKKILKTRGDSNKVFYRIADERIVRLIALTRQVFCAALDRRRRVAGNQVIEKFVIDNWPLIAVAVVSGLMLIWPLFAGRGGNRVSTLEATQLINQKDAVIVDIRDQAEFARGHIAGARSLPGQGPRRAACRSRQAQRARR